jgi:hypothetical protein
LSDKTVSLDEDNFMQLKSRKERVKESFSLIRELFKLLRENRKWWLLPFFIVLFLVSLLGILIGGSSILPTLYALF